MSTVTTKDDFLCSTCLLGLHFVQLIGWWICVGVFVKIYLSSYSLILLPYLYWVYAIDYETPDKEGRPLKCLINSKIAKYIRDYYPTRISKSEDYELDPKKNYVCVLAPHGVLGVQAYMAFGTIFDTTKEIFPNHKPQCSNISAFYRIPLYREILLAIGAGSSSSAAITYALKKPEGGRIVGLVPGGAAESYHAWPHTYKTIIKRRKGFVRIALKTGAPIIPVVSFNINDDFDYQLRHPALRWVQDLLKKVTYVALIVARGRYGFTLFPKRVQCNFVAGKPIIVPKIDDPSQEQIDNVHNEFVQRYEEVFEKHKHNYVKNPDKTYLEFV